MKSLVTVFKFKRKKSCAGQYCTHFSFGRLNILVFCSVDFTTNKKFKETGVDFMLNKGRASRSQR